MSLAKGKKKERILRVLLNFPNGKLSKYRIAKEAETSFPWVHEFLDDLDRLGYIEGTRVVNYSAVFEFWKNSRGHVQKKNFVINDPLSLLSEVRLKYALTTYQGENFVQGYLFPSRYDIYIEKEDFDSWNEVLKQHGLMGPGNFRLMIDDNHVFYNSIKINDYSVVSIPQLIVDLYIEGGVCGEAADSLVKRLAQNNV